MKEVKDMEKEWRFCVVGNVRKSHIGEDGKEYYGTKAFKGGTKIYIYTSFLPKGKTEAGVIGLNRFGRVAYSKRIVNC